MKDKTIIQIRDVPNEIHETLRRLSFENRVSINKLVLRALAEFAEKNKEGK